MLKDLHSYHKRVLYDIVAYHIENIGFKVTFDSNFGVLFKPFLKYLRSYHARVFYGIYIIIDTHRIEFIGFGLQFILGLYCPYRNNNIRLITSCCM